MGNYNAWNVPLSWRDFSIADNEKKVEQYYNRMSHGNSYERGMPDIFMSHYSRKRKGYSE